MSFSSFDLYHYAAVHRVVNGTSHGKITMQRIETALNEDGHQKLSGMLNRGEYKEAKQYIEKFEKQGLTNSK